ncbi:alpha/beta hydrolase [Sphingomonas sp. HF-S3]|uniref:Alpha/beta hydrolase n=1 Tax=Sphingomonas rustica TaxID=3103142 RepID=A0ABV0BAC7_9SPHN
MSGLVWILAIVVLILAALALWAGHVARGVEKLVPADGRILDLGGARIHYTDQGSGPPIVMIHGLLGQVRNFADLAARMAVDHRVIVIDRPGWGHSSMVAPRPDIAAQGEIVAAFIRALDVEKPVLVGHSMGGAVALAVGIAHPELVGGLTLIAPYTHPAERPPAVFRPMHVPAPLRTPLAWTIATPIGMRTGAARTARVFAPDLVPADFATRGGAALSLRPRSFQSGSFELGMAHDSMMRLSQRYGAIEVPVAILYGHGDEVLDPELHGTDAAAAIPDATIDLIDGGHMLQVVYPAETEAWLRRSIARFNGS